MPKSVSMSRSSEAKAPTKPAKSAQEKAKKEAKSTTSAKKADKKQISPFGRLVRKFFIYLLILVILVVGLGTLIGIFVVPTVENWLGDHNFIKKQETTQITKETDPEKVKERLEELNSQAAKSVEEEITEIVEAVSPAVVSIAVADVELQQGGGVKEKADNIGTGFIVDSKGVIVTNQHVVSDPNASYKVITNSEKSYDVKKIVRDDANDIALVIIEANNLPALTLGNSSYLKVGQTVLAIGTPLGEFPGTVTKGIISGLGRTVEATEGGFFGTIRSYEDVIQTDAAVNPGNSGGPLINLDGEVIGVNFATTGGADNLSFALPINTVTKRLEEYKSYGKFIKPFVGVEYEIITSQQALFYDVVPGALVRSVVSGGPADKAGIKKGDIITKVGGEKVTTSLSVLVQDYNVGDKVKVELWRNNKTKTVEVTLGEMP